MGDEPWTRIGRCASGWIRTRPRSRWRWPSRARRRGPLLRRGGPSPESMRRLSAKLAGKHERLHFCYEAGPTGYGLHRLLTGLGHSCVVVAPSLIPRKPGDRVKTNRRDALSLARLLRAGELTPIWVPDTAHEAVRNLVRARAAAVKDVGLKKRQVGAFLLRHSRLFPRKKNWGARYRAGWRRRASSTRPTRSCCRRASRASARGGAARAPRPGDRGVPPDLEPRPAGRGAAGAARRRPGHGGDVRGRGRRHPPLRQPAPADGLPRPGAGRALHRGDGAARLDHQDGQRAGAPPARRERLDLPPPAAGREGEASQARARVAQGPRDRVEGAEPADGPLPGAHGARQEDDRDHCTAIARELAAFMWAVAREARPA